MGLEDFCKILHKLIMTCRELNMIVGELDTIYDGDSDEASCNDGHQKTCVWKRRLTGQQAVIVPVDLV